MYLYVVVTNTIYILFLNIIYVVAQLVTHCNVLYFEYAFEEGIELMIYISSCTSNMNKEPTHNGNDLL